MMRGSVAMLGSPLESGMIWRPGARAGRTRSVISTVADGLREVTRSASCRPMILLVLLEGSQLNRGGSKLPHRAVLGRRCAEPRGNEAHHLIQGESRLGRFARTIGQGLDAARIGQRVIMCPEQKMKPPVDVAARKMRACPCQSVDKKCAGVVEMLRDQAAGELGLLMGDDGAQPHETARSLIAGR